MKGLRVRKQKLIADKVHVFSEVDAHYQKFLIKFPLKQSKAK